MWKQGWGNLIKKKNKIKNKKRKMGKWGEREVVPKTEQVRKSVKL